MPMVRRLTIWSAPVLLLSLAVLCIYAAFLGADAAGGFFSSTPALVFWFLLLADFVVAIVCFPGLRARPGLLALHAGPVLVILGTMYGSRISHQMRGHLGWPSGTESGYLVVREGQSAHALQDKELDEQVGTLPFRVRLEDFRLERYSRESDRWKLFCVVRGGTGPSPRGKGTEETDAGMGTGGQSGSSRARQVPLDWAEGEEVRVPGTDIRVTVLRYLPRAEAVYEDEGRPALEIVRDGKDTISLPAREGESVTLQDPAVQLHIQRVFSNLQVQGAAENRQVIDAEGSGNPALEVELKKEGQDARQVYIMPRYPMHGQHIEGVTLHYAVPQPTRARPDPNGSTPAMKVKARAGDDEMTGWLIVEKGRKHARLSLAPLLEGREKDGTRALYLAEPGAPPKSYSSELAVVEEGQVVGKKTVEVNDPLHYGGYHLYQSSYDRQNHAYTILLVRSDDGLWMVYAGFLLLGGGAIWFCWARPVMRHFERGRKQGAGGTTST